jgi:hypothetical protein
MYILRHGVKSSCYRGYRAADRGVYISWHRGYRGVYTGIVVQLIQGLKSRLHKRCRSVDTEGIKHLIQGHRAADTGV